MLADEVEEGVVSGDNAAMGSVAQPVNEFQDLITSDEVPIEMDQVVEDSPMAMPAMSMPSDSVEVDLDNGTMVSSSTAATMPSLGASGPTSVETAKVPTFYHLAYYRPLFDVDSEEVLFRALAVFDPRKDWNHLVKSRPDLYGPFWTAATLVFLVAVVGNFVAYWHFKPTESQKEWIYDFRKVTGAGALIFGYVFLVPCALWAALAYHKVECKLLPLVCNYGYSTSIFIPTVLLCVIPSNIVRWVVLAVATALSALMIVKYVKATMVRGMPAASKSAEMPILGGVLVLHLAMAIPLKLYFFSF